MMEKRQGFVLKEFLFFWNLILAVFSFMGAVNFFQNARILLHQGPGLQKALCIYKYSPDGGACFWLSAFAVSKIYEFGDTAFIVLRKKPLMFLHYWHHVTVLVVTWLFTVHEKTHSIILFPAFVNYAIHTVMYSYFSLSAVGIRFPSFIPMLITATQIIQMFLINAAYIIGYTSCDDIPLHVVLIGGVIVTSYAVLFAMYFCKRYIFTNKKLPLPADDDRKEK
jgi:hypothetical protein